MKQAFWAIFRIALFILTIIVWLWIRDHRFSNHMSLIIIVGCVLMVFPVVWTGRKLLDKRTTISRAVKMNTFVHFTLMILLGAAIIEAVKTHQGWSGWIIPVPVEISFLLVVGTSIATLLTVVNLALKGLGAPFAVALSRKLAVDWFYAWTRNPMVLGTLAFLVALGIWFQSFLFVFWVLVLVTPAWLFFVKLYEERELEIRFGAPYLEYKAKTPMLFPKRPRA